MAKGEAYKETFKLIPVGTPNQESINYLEEKKQRCEYVLPVFADEFSDDVYRNDITSEYWGYSEVITGVTFKLLQCDIEVKTLNDNTYGKYYPYGFHFDEVRKYAGFQIDWKTILLDPDLGEGEYQIKIEATTIFGGDPLVELSQKYCLKQFTVPRAEGTVRIEYYNNSIIGDKSDDTLRTSYKGLNWYNSLRLPSAFFGFERSEYEEEEIEYYSGRVEKAFDRQDILYDLEIRLSPNYIHRRIKIEILQSDDIYITDYNSNNPIKPILRKRVLRASNYEPEWQPRSKKAPAKITFKQKVNNLKKKYS